MLSALFKPAPRAEPSEYLARVRTGEVLLVDVREPAEWRRGVAQSAALLSFSDLRGSRQQWRPFLAQAGQREILLYCASGMRSASATHLLEAEGFRAINAGSLADWANAGWPVVSPRH